MGGVEVWLLPITPRLLCPCQESNPGSSSLCRGQTRLVVACIYSTAVLQCPWEIDDSTPFKNKIHHCVSFFIFRWIERLTQVRAPRPVDHGRAPPPPTMQLPFHIETWFYQTTRRRVSQHSIPCGDRNAKPRSGTRGTRLLQAPRSVKQPINTSKVYICVRRQTLAYADGGGSPVHSAASEFRRSCPQWGAKYDRYSRPWPSNEVKRGGTEVWLHSYLTTALDGGEWTTWLFGHLTSLERMPVHIE
jgi:hypothetical protein